MNNIIDFFKTIPIYILPYDVYGIGENIDPDLQYAPSQSHLLELLRNQSDPFNVMLEYLPGKELAVMCGTCSEFNTFITKTMNYNPLQKALCEQLKEELQKMKDSDFHFTRDRDIHDLILNGIKEHLFEFPVDSPLFIKLLDEHLDAASRIKLYKYLFEKIGRVKTYIEEVKPKNSFLLEEIDLLTQEKPNFTLESFIVNLNLAGDQSEIYKGFRNNFEKSNLPNLSLSWWVDLLELIDWDMLGTEMVEKHFETVA